MNGKSKFQWLVFFKQKTAYEMRISEWSSDVCSSDRRGVTSLVSRRRGERLQSDCGYASFHHDRFRHGGYRLADGWANVRQGGPFDRSGAKPHHNLRRDRTAARKSEGRRVGKAGVSYVRSRWAPYH